jgi:hypothetical protein
MPKEGWRVWPSLKRAAGRGMSMQSTHLSIVLLLLQRHRVLEVCELVPRRLAGLKRRDIQI